MKIILTFLFSLFPEKLFLKKLSWVHFETASAGVHWGSVQAQTSSYHGHIHQLRPHHYSNTVHIHKPLRHIHIHQLRMHKHSTTALVGTPTHHKHIPLTDHNSHKTLQNAPITPHQVLDLDTYQTPLSHHMSLKSFTELLNLVYNECENMPLVDSPAPPKTIGNSNWESFTSHFTQEFEWLKAEVDGLRNEVRNLRRTVRELNKGNRTLEVRVIIISSQTLSKSDRLAISNMNSTSHE